MIHIRLRTVESCLTFWKQKCSLHFSCSSSLSRHRTLGTRSSRVHGPIQIKNSSESVVNFQTKHNLHCPAKIVMARYPLRCFPIFPTLLHSKRQYGLSSSSSFTRRPWRTISLNELKDVGVKTLRVPVTDMNREPGFRPTTRSRPRQCRGIQKVSATTTCLEL